MQSYNDLSKDPIKRTVRKEGLSDGEWQEVITPTALCIKMSVKEKVTSNYNLHWIVGLGSFFGFDLFISLCLDHHAKQPTKSLH